jgi:RNA polymerase sigma factor (sigma-70 family)
LARTEAGGQGQRFEELLVPHLDAAHNLARFITRDATAAQDVVQDAFIRAFRSFAGYRGGDAKSWLLAIVRNCSFDWLRSGRRPDANAPMDPDELADVDVRTPEHSAVRNDEIATVRAMIHRLPEPFRETLVLRELEELSYRQIAAVTGVPIGTVMSRLARARRLLTEDLERTL